MALVGNILGFYRRDNPRKIIKTSKINGTSHGCFSCWYKGEERIQVHLKQVEKNPSFHTDPYLLPERPPVKDRQRALLASPPRSILSI